MCFSATASFIAGGALGVVGVLTLAQVKNKAELPLAGIPLLFGVQQIAEGAVWLSFGNHALNTFATYAYSMFSHVLWPILIPFSLLLLETDPFRKKILRLFSCMGLAVGLYLLYSITKDSVTARIVNSSIAYDSPHLYFPLVLTFYVLATCVSSFISSYKIIRIFGIIALISLFIAGWFFAETFISVWCFFAAVLSGLVYWYFKSKPEKDLVPDH